MPAQRLLIATLLLTFVLAACTGRVTRGPDPATPSSEVRVAKGDVIRIVTKQRQRFSLEVTAIGTDAIAGRTVERARLDTVAEGTEISVPFADVALIEAPDPQKARDEAETGVVAFFTAAGYVIGWALIPWGI